MDGKPESTRDHDTTDPMASLKMIRENPVLCRGEGLVRAVTALDPGFVAGPAHPRTGTCRRVCGVLEVRVEDMELVVVDGIDGLGGLLWPSAARAGLGGEHAVRDRRASGEDGSGSAR